MKIITKLKSKHRLWLLLMLCNSSILFAQQQIQLKGVVSDNSDILPGVSVTIKGKTQGTLTDANGVYNLIAKGNDTLVFSYIGYKTAEIPVNKHPTINITLQEDTTLLNEVVINAGYYSVKDRERTGSISKITNKEIGQQPVTDVIATMQGRMPGVQITQKSGVPGGGYSIKIRGINSLRAEANNPLYIIDGVPLMADNMSNQQISASAIPEGVINPLNNINPDDIESIEVLKDADATAIYGSRGANGVVLITTKKSKEEGTHFSINTHSGIGKTINRMKLMNTQQYLVMRQKAFENDGITEYPTNAYDINGTWDKNRYTDWRKELMGETAHYNSTQISVSGGSALTRFLISGTFQKENSVFKTDTEYKRTALQSNVNHRSKDNRFTLNSSVIYTLSNNKLPGGNLVLAAYTLSPNAPSLYSEDGSLNWENGTFQNPLARAQSIYKNKNYLLSLNNTLSYKFNSAFLLKVNTGYSRYSIEEISTLPSTIYDPSRGMTSSSSSMNQNQGNINNWIIEPQLEWSKDFGKSLISVLAGATFQVQNSDLLHLSGSNFSSNSFIETISAANSIRVNSHTINKYKYQAFFGRVNYNYNGKYIINLTGRRDGSSRFGDNKRFANFGAIGAAWVFNKEQFLEDNSWLSFGKLRASYGITGSDQIGDYQYLDTYALNSSTAGSYDGTIGLYPTRLYNADFGWEVNKKLEAALNIGLFKDKINLELAWYQNRSSNQLVGIPLSSVTGFNSVLANLDATVQNTGVELAVNAMWINSPNWQWQTMFNISFERNKLLSFPNLEESTYANRYAIGKSINIQKMYHYIGVNPETGVYQFEDYNRDEKISFPEDNQSIQDLLPKYYGGITNTIKYKNLSLSFLLTFSKQRAFNYAITNAGMPGVMKNQPIFIHSNPDIQKYSSGSSADASQAFSNFTSSDAIIDNASYLKLKNVELSYLLPQFKNISGRIYFQAQNVFTITPFKGIDPETSYGLFIPPLKTFYLGLQLNL